MNNDKEKKISKSRSLSSRELSCLRLLAEGYKANQIAKKLSIKKSTVNTYIERLKEKMQVYSLRDLLSQVHSETTVEKWIEKNFKNTTYKIKNP